MFLAGATRANSCADLALVADDAALVELVDALTRDAGSNDALANDEAALGWRIAYDLRAPGSTKGKSPAERAFSAISSSLDARVGRAAKRDASFVCFVRGAIGPLGVLRKGDTLVVVAGPAKTSARGGWSDAGTCAKSEKWASEIAGQ